MVRRIGARKNYAEVAAETGVTRARVDRIQKRARGRVVRERRRNGHDV